MLWRLTGFAVDGAGDCGLPLEWSELSNAAVAVDGTGGGQAVVGHCSFVEAIGDQELVGWIAADRSHFAAGNVDAHGGRDVRLAASGPASVIDVFRSAADPHTLPAGIIHSWLNCV